MRTYTKCLYVLLALTALPAAADPAVDPKVAWLRSHAVALDSIDPAATDFSDLAPLRTILDGVRVVMLGEATRGDGNTFLAKTRLIRFLVREMGFDVLAFEGGLYDCALARDEIRAGGDPRRALDRALFPQWTRAEQFQPLIELVAARSASGRPLEIAGFDSQVTGEAGAENLVGDLRRQLVRRGMDPARIAGFSAAAKILDDVARDAYAAGDAAVPTRRERRRFADTLETIRRRLEAPAAAGDAEAAFWRQLLTSLATQARASWKLGAWDPREPLSPEIHNVRDRQMAENLLWLARERYPERKIIGWSLTLHVARDLDRLTTGEADTRKRLDAFSVVGDFLAEELGDQAYVLAFTAFAGKKGTVFRRPHPLLVPTSGSFEDLMARTGLEAAIVDLRRLPPGGRWLRRGLIARPISYKELLGIWPRHVDGFVFLRAQEPVRRSEGGARLEAGFLLRQLQQGVSLSLPWSRPMPDIGARCHELRVSDGEAYWLKAKDQCPPYRDGTRPTQGLCCTHGSGPVGPEGRHGGLPLRFYSDVRRV